MIVSYARLACTHNSYQSGTNKGLPGYKYLEPSWGNNPTLPGAKSDPVLDFGMLSQNLDGDDSIRYFRNMSIYPGDNPGREYIHS